MKVDLVQTNLSLRDGGWITVSRYDCDWYGVSLYSTEKGDTSSVLYVNQSSPEHFTNFLEALLGLNAESRLYQRVTREHNEAIINYIEMF